LIVGAGIVGCATAYFLAREGVKSVVLERTGPAAEASGANAGMIGVGGGLENDTLAFLRPSVELIFQAERELDLDFDLVREGRLMLALDETDLDHRAATHAFAQAADVRSELLDGPALREVEPALGELVLGAQFLPDDGHIDPGLLTRAYMQTAERLGARLERGPEVTRLAVDSGRVVGVYAGETLYPAEHVVLAAGAWSRGLAATVGLDLPIQPGKGQMLATEPLPRITTRVLRGPVVGMRQTRQGEVIIGSTVEHVGFDYQVRPETIADFHRRMADSVPALRTARISRTWAGLRPMTPDSLPIVGRAFGLPGLYLACGHSRAGMSYGPGTARAIVDLITRGTSSLPIARFQLTRFAPAVTSPS
jgi:glycine/D-amino acid oxidase-like deaminating enzyme